MTDTNQKPIEGDAQVEAWRERNNERNAARDLGPCWRCGGRPTVSADSYTSVACDNCYDGAPDSPTRNECGSGLTMDAAVADWNTLMEDAMDAANEEMASR